MRVICVSRASGDELVQRPSRNPKNLGWRSVAVRMVISMSLIVGRCPVAPRNSAQLPQSTPSGSPPAGTARALREQPPADSKHCKAIDRRHCAPSSQRAPAVELPRTCDAGVCRTQSIGRRTRPRTAACDATRLDSGCDERRRCRAREQRRCASTAVDASRSSFLGWVWAGSEHRRGDRHPKYTRTVDHDAAVA